MSFPPQFSSTLKYEARYDLDEIDVFMEGMGNNPMFFSVTGLPNLLSYGKHYFNISLLDAKKQQYKLKEGSRLLFEFKSINGVILKSDVVKLNQRNGTALCFVEVLEDPLRTFKSIEDGDATLIVAGKLENTNRTQDLIPDKFLDAYNYRCIFNIEIRKNILNANSPFPISSGHNLATTKGQFTFVKAAIPTRRNSDVGTKYNASGQATNKPKIKSGKS